ncbi:hypothetical protein EV702DRAFT_1048708 [Suillus placidus]|uniref:Uncharacterized protein n=1 Tax=Suillus placidus TaxID=48579 RepID=A0A9P6ZMF8_9AGAM|nr:hypothetical protein EV702DRAFT_1048708 [Suillus placidus]
MCTKLLHLAFQLVLHVHQFMLVHGHKNVQDGQTRIRSFVFYGQEVHGFFKILRLRIVALEDALLWDIWYTGSMLFKLINPSPHASILTGLTHPLDYVSPGQQGGDDKDGDLPDIIPVIVILTKYNMLIGRIEQNMDETFRNGLYNNAINKLTKDKAEVELHDICISPLKKFAGLDIPHAEISKPNLMEEATSSMQVLSVNVASGWSLSDTRCS